MNRQSFAVVALIANACINFEAYAGDLNGARPAGLRFGLGVTIFKVGYEFVNDTDGLVIGPSCALTYLNTNGLGVDFSASYFEEDAFYSFTGGSAAIGMVYRIPKTALLLRGGWMHFGGTDGDGGNTNADGFYVGLGTILRTHKHFGIRADLSGARLTRFLGTSFGLKVSVGFTFLPKPKS